MKINLLQEPVERAPEEEKETAKFAIPRTVLRPKEVVTFAAYGS